MENLTELIFKEQRHYAMEMMNVTLYLSSIIREKSLQERRQDNLNSKKHLPLIGVGPIIVIPQIALTIIGIILSAKGIIIDWHIKILKVPFVILGILFILYGFLLWYAANFKTKIDKHIENNKLATKGVYSIVRNPIYSAFLIIDIGFIFIENNLILFIIPIVCWLYMTILLKNTEEKWLYKLYGNEYKKYCKKVNRCIPIKRISKRGERL